MITNIPAATRRRIIRAAVGLGFCLAALWAAHIAAVAYVPRTEWYLAAERFIRSNPEVSAEVGRIANLEVISAGGFRSWFSSDWENAQLRVRVTGSKGTVRVSVSLVKTTGRWMPEAGTLELADERRLKLK